MHVPRSLGIVLLGVAFEEMEVQEHQLVKAITALYSGHSLAVVVLSLAAQTLQLELA